MNPGSGKKNGISLLLQDDNEKRHLAEIYFISLTVLLYLFRTSIPFFKYPFLICYVGLAAYIFIIRYKQIIPAISETIQNYYLVILLAIILITSFLLSHKIFLTIFKDVINSLILMSFLFLIPFSINNRKSLTLFSRSIINLIVFFSFIISIDGIFKVFNILSVNPIIMTGGSLLTYKDIDYNFAVLPVIMGAIGAIYLLTRTNSLITRLVFNIFLISFSLFIFLSGSRRGMFVFGLFVVLLLFSQLFSIFKNNLFLKKIGSCSRSYILLLAGLSVLSFVTVKYASCDFKNKILEASGSKNILSAKVSIASKTYKYYQLIDNNILFSDYYDLIWTPEFNPLDPESGWGRRMHRTTFPLTGKNVEIVPAGAKGYLMDSTCNADTWNGDAFSYSAFATATSEKDTVVASVYCYMSEDFNGSWARIICGRGDVSIADGNEYNLSNKGTWQKLICKVCCSKGKLGFLLYFSKTGVIDFSTLKGYIIFAYPGIEVKGTVPGSSINTSGFSKNVVDPHLKEIPLTHPSELPGQFRTGFFSFNLLSFISQKQNLINKEDPVRNWASKFISEDTTFYNHRNELVVNPSWDRFNSERILHWVYGWLIFTKEFSLSQKIFGGGFNFLNWYSYYFLNDKTGSDWPHNPFLSILLYSGIVGLIIYCYFLFKVFSYYIKHIREFLLMFIFFLLTFFFTFFSGGSPFDPPVFGFFSILPFIIHSILKNDKPELIKFREN